MNYNEFKAKFVEKELEELEVQIKIMLRQKPHRSVVEFSKIINKIRHIEYIASSLVMEEKGKRFSG